MNDTPTSPAQSPKPVALRITPKCQPGLRKIPGYPHYSITRNGQVVSYMEYISGRFLKSTPNKLGYHRIRLAALRGGRQKTLEVHSLVALSWIGPRPIGLDVAHLDGNPANNNVANLAYVTRRENMSHTERHGTKPNGERSGTARLKTAQVIEILSREESSSVLGKIYGVSRTHIQDIRAGKKWKHLTSKST